MIADAAPLQYVPALVPEEAARADFYGLLARLFCAAPDEALLETLAAADEIVAEDSAASFALAWRDLALAAAAADAAAVAQEYQTLFVGTGRAPVSLYAATYLVNTAVDAPLVELRNYLATRNLARRTSVFEPEDHFAALCELMRLLIAEQHAPLAEQMSVFSHFLWPATAPLCAAICGAEQAVFYRAVACFAERFLEIEYAAFRM
ncbi:MAG: TorD/DmsD family molecular chaperone [Burkholderiales bacterium]